MEFKHITVLLNETIDGLNIKDDGIYVDGTLGGGGHSLEICKRLGQNGRLIGIDQDDAAIEAGSKRLNEYKKIVSIHKSNYSNMRNVLKQEGILGVDGILLDLGVSSHQLDVRERGFSYMGDAPLDMRMDRSKEVTAKDIVNNYEEYDLFRIIRDYGEEKFARRIARNIVKDRQEYEIETSQQLVEIIKKSMPVKAHFSGGHPAKRTFQAIRIEVNEELDVLEDSINNMIDLLKDNGRLCIITFHSLEDRIVKKIFRENQDPCTCPREFPICICNKKSKGKVITRKPILPTEVELEYNRRSKSAKLRIFEKKF